MPGRVPKGLAIRFWFLWLRYSYRFRWAHRPLCAHFRAGVLRFGDVHLCRSCVCVYAGLIVGGVLCLCSEALRESSALVLWILTGPTVILSTPSLYHRLARGCKDMLRCSMGICMGLCVCAVFQVHPLLAAGCAGVLFGFWKLYFAQRRRRRAEACQGCPEYGREAICSGCRLQAEAIRAYETEATDLLMASHGWPAEAQSPRDVHDRTLV